VWIGSLGKQFSSALEVAQRVQARERTMMTRMTCLEAEELDTLLMVPYAET
jgi:hypothetical protein